MKCAYTVHPSWFGGEVQARKGIEELAQHTLNHMRRKGVRQDRMLMSWWDIVSITHSYADCQIATIEYGS